MDSYSFSQAQLELIAHPFTGTIFLEGIVGSGKTTGAAARLERMLQEGIPTESVLILLPQRTLAFPYAAIAQQAALPSGGMLDILTLGGLAQRMCALFWPLIARAAGFKHPERPPIFLTLETAQYYLAKVIAPLLDKGYFSDLAIDRNRLYSQILDNLNKAAAVGFDPATFGERLSAAYAGDPKNLHNYSEAQECANLFRADCLENNLLDFSLQMEVFCNHLWKSALCRKYLNSRYRHLIYDNLEEDIPIAQDIVREWVPDLDSALLIMDAKGGYRVFLGADPENGASLQAICQEHPVWNQSWIISQSIAELHLVLLDALGRRKQHVLTASSKAAFSFQTSRFYPDMVQLACDEVARLVTQENIPPGEIAILAPLVSDSLRFSLLRALEQRQIPARSHRPSRSLRDEPATHCLLTLAKLAHPDWKLTCSRHDVRTMLLQAIAGLDLVRADLLAKIVYSERKPEQALSSFERIQPEMQNRIRFTVGARYETLRKWMLEYQTGAQQELAAFLSRLFGEVLSQPGFGFHSDFDAAAVTARLIESIQKFRWATVDLLDSGGSTGKEYLQMVEKGILAAQYLQTWQPWQEENTVLVAPAYTFLMSSRPVRYQFWLDVGSQSWFERLYQPLTQPYILSRRWIAGEHWTDTWDFQTNQSALERIVTGLMLRCREHVVLCTAGMNEQGSEQRGPLLMALQSMLRQSLRAEAV